MVRVKLVNVTKRFGDVIAVNNVSFEVKEGELFTLLGPSGCGKTTTLRLIAGFYKPDSGEIYFNDELVNNIPPYKRNTGMVFQNYALWPHMRVFDNVSYGLKLRNWPPRKIIKRVKEMLKLVGLAGKEKRYPSELSGGEQQRVALARALVIEPRVLLLDEPLSNLDAKLRVKMRSEIRKIQKKLGITTIYVTHDQEEALSISDRIAVMNKGKILQIGDPVDIYEKPKDIFVNDFIGTTNFIPARVIEVDSKARKIILNINDQKIVKDYYGDVEVGMDVICAVRPESLSITSLSEKPKDKPFIVGRIDLIDFLGKIIRYEIETDFGLIRVDTSEKSLREKFKEGDKVAIVIEPETIRIFTK